MVTFTSQQNTDDSFTFVAVYFVLGTVIVLVVVLAYIVWIKSREVAELKQELQVQVTDDALASAGASSQTSGNASQSPSSVSQAANTASGDIAGQS